MDRARYRRLFLEGVREQLEAIEPALAALGRGEGEGVGPTLRRAWHSLKGMSATMGYDGLARLAHAGEELFRRPLPAVPPPGLLSTLNAAYQGLAAAVAALERGEEPPDLSALEAQVRKAQDGAPGTAPPAPSPLTHLPGSVRVATTDLDGLLAETADLETVLAALLPAAPAAGAAAPAGSLDAATAARLRHGIRRLRRRVDQLRLLPFSLVIPSLERLVAAVAARCRKAARLQVAGGDLRLDRATLEVLLVPLQHLLTNAVDHGLEDPQGRRRAGKDGTGTVHLQLAGGAETLRLTVQDDGAGVDLASVARKLGSSSPPAAAAAESQEITELLCRPGLSTASETTATSGRGIGLDAVREAVLGAGGRLTLTQRPGAGLRAEVVLPRTVSVASCLLARDGGSTYGIPLASVDVVEDGAGGAGVPSLGDLLAGRRAPSPTGSVRLRLHAPGRPPLAVAVDLLLGRLDAVVRPLPGRLSAPAVAGTALCGDGTPVIILDPAHLPAADPTGACPASG